MNSNYFRNSFTKAAATWSAFEIPLPKDAYYLAIEIPWNSVLGEPEDVRRYAGQLIEKRRFVSGVSDDKDNQLIWYIYDKDKKLIEQGITYGS